MNTSTTRRRRSVTLTWLDLVHAGIFGMFLMLAHFSLGSITTDSAMENHERSSRLSWLDVAQLCIFGLFIVLAHHALG